MAQSIFAGNQVHAGGFRADQLQLYFGGVSVRGLMVQSINFSFSQQVAMLYEVGSNYVYYVGGRSQGTAALSHIVGPARRGARLLQLFRDLCRPQDIGFDAAAGCQPGGVNYTLIDAVLVGLAVGVTAQDVVINKNLSFMYIDLEHDGLTDTDSVTTLDDTAPDGAVPDDQLPGEPTIGDNGELIGVPPEPAPELINVDPTREPELIGVDPTREPELIGTDPLPVFTSPHDGPVFGGFGSLL